MIPSLGLCIPEVLAPAEGVDLAVSLESTDLDTAWFTEIDREPFVRSSAVLARTEAINVGTGIALWTRSPVTMATTAAELHQLAEGRFVLGIGAGAAHLNKTLYNIPFERPLRRMSEYLEVMRGVWKASSDPFNFAGDYFDIKAYTQPYFQEGPPLLLAAVGDGMLRLAARHADGLVMNPSTTPWYIRTHVNPQLSAGAAQAGRPLSGFRRSVIMRASVDRDRATARHRARHGIVDYGRYAVHQKQYAMYGFGREAELIREATARGDIAAAVAAVSEEMIDVLGLAGTPEDVRRALSDWEGTLDAAAFLSPTFDLPIDEVRSNCVAIMEMFSS